MNYLHSSIVLLFTAMVFGGLPQQGAAQYAFHLELGVLNDPQDFTSEPPVGFALSLRYDITEHFRAGATYGRFSRREGSGSDFRRRSMNPVTGFFEYRFLDGDFSPFAVVDFGFYISRVVSDNIVSEAGLDFGASPGGGFLYKLSDGVVLSLTGRYHYLYRDSDFLNLLGVTLGVRTSF